MSSNKSNVTARLTTLEHSVEELKRKSRGATKANGKFAQVERELARLKSRVDNLPERPSSVQSDAVNQELTRLDGVIKDHYRDLQGQIAQLSDDLGEVGQRVTRLESSDIHQIDFEATRVELEHRFETPWVEALVVGIIAGVLAAISLNWWIAEDWQAPEDWAVSVIVAIAAFWVMASFERLSSTGRLIWMRRTTAEEVPQTVSLETIRVEPEPLPASQRVELQPQEVSASVNN